MASRPLVAVGMSGGVDSSVAACLLKEQGYEVIGLFMKNWEETDPSGHCLSSNDYEDVISVCKHLSIPYYSLNFVTEYRERVFSHFLEDYQAGGTPNPDILCNREIKFNLFFSAAMKMGAEFLATGHYAQNECRAGQQQLLKGADLRKDQSYFLYTLTDEVLKRVLFPIGSWQKSSVRTFAKEKGLSTAEKKDSTGICFIGERNFRPFLNQYIQYTPGNFETLEGKILGEHLGIAFYTIGQRKDLRIGGEGEAWFVVGKDRKRNVVFVAQGASHPALFCDDLIASNLTWISQSPPPFPFTCSAKIRYRQEDQECVIYPMEEGNVRVEFAHPQRAATPRQSIVFYHKDLCLGGGIIEAPGPSYYHKGKKVP